MDLSINEIKRVLEETELASKERLELLLETLPQDARPSDAESLLKFLIEKKILTNYQAQVILRGKGLSLRLGSYVIEDKLGQGGMGMVYRSRHVRMKREVALKVVSGKMSKDPEMMKRFRREVEAAAKLHHPNIVVAHDASDEAGTAYLVMEYIDGKDLAAIVKKKGPLKISQAVNFIYQAALGLEYAHSQGVIHRDIKPSNLLLDHSGAVKILDMGLARIEEEEGAAELTATGAVMGTIDYMAPEQAISTKHATAQSDIYSLGCSLWYLLTARPMFGGESLMAKLLSHRSEPIPSLRDAREDVSEELQAIFEKMVAKKAENRYGTMTEVVADLERFRSGNTALTAMSSMYSNDDDQLEDYLQDSAETLAAQEAIAVSKRTRGSSSRTREDLVDTDSMQEFQSFMLPPIATGSQSRARRTATRKLPWWQNWKITGSIAGGAGLLAIVVLLASGGNAPAPPEPAKANAAKADTTQAGAEVTRPDLGRPDLPEPAILAITPTQPAVTPEQIAKTVLDPGSAGDGNLAQEVFQFLIDKPELTDWKPLQILESKSEQGAVLTEQPDGSLLVTGENLTGDAYEVVVSCQETQIDAIRLEALTNNTLPRNGPGRHETGNFQLSSFELYRGRLGKRLFEERIPFSQAFTDYEYFSDNVDVESIIHDDRTEVWHVWARFGEPRFAVFIPTQPVSVTPGEPLTIRIKHVPGNDSVNLGCFRLSAASAPVNVRNEKLLLALRQNAFDQNLSACAAYLIKGAPQQAHTYIERSRSLSPSDPQFGNRLLLQTLVAVDTNNSAEADQSYSELAVWMQANYFAIAPLRSLAIDVMEAVGKQSRTKARRMVIRHYLGTQVTRFRREIEKDPAGSVGPYYYLARTLAQFESWQEAADVELESLKHFPEDSFQWMRAATFLLMAGNDEQYQKTCKDFLQALGKSSDPGVAERICKICLLEPGVVPLSRLPSETLRKGLTDNKPGLGHWLRATMALGAYREKKYRDGLNLLQSQSETGNPEFDALLLVVRAMTEFQLGDKPSASATYLQAEKLIPRELRPQPSSGDNAFDYLESRSVNHDFLIAEVLRREAKQLIFRDSTTP